MDTDIQKELVTFIFKAEECIFYCHHLKKLTEKKQPSFFHGCLPNKRDIPEASNIINQLFNKTH
jgi:hypothetical protein